MLTTDFYLRGLEACDFDFLKSIENNPQLRDCTDAMGPYTDAELQAHITTHPRSTGNSQHRFVLSDLQHTPLGFVDLYCICKRKKEAKVGIVIDHQYHRKGYGSQALQLLEAIAFNQLNIKSLQAEVRVNNPPSVGLFLKAGYCQSATYCRWNIRDVVLQEYHSFYKTNDHV